jgi:hypothetical protein
MMPLQYLPAAAALLLLLPPGHGSGGGGNLTVEPWYVGLQHFGPLSGEGWGQRKMTLVRQLHFSYRESHGGSRHRVHVRRTCQWPAVPSAGSTELEAGQDRCGGTGELDSPPPPAGTAVAGTAHIHR